MLTGEVMPKQDALPCLRRTAFPKASMLEAHLAMLEEAKKRDHRKNRKRA